MQISMSSSFPFNFIAIVIVVGRRNWRRSQSINLFTAKIKSVVFVILIYDNT